MKPLPACVSWHSLCLSLALASAALAQRPNQEVPRENVEVAGTLKQVAAGALLVATDAGEQWRVQLEGRPQEMKLSFSGKAEPSFLRSGMLVQFAGTVNKRGQVQEKLDSLTITSLREGVEVGVYPEGGIGRSGEFFSDAKPEERQKKGAAKASPKPEAKPDAVPCRITGYVSKISRTGELTVNCGKATVKANLAENARLSIDLNNLSFAQPGDKVEVRGWYIKNQKGTAWSREVSVSAANVLGEAKKPRGTEKEAKEGGQTKPETAKRKSADKESKTEGKTKADEAKGKE